MQQSTYTQDDAPLKVFKQGWEARAFSFGLFAFMFFAFAYSATGLNLSDPIARGIVIVFMILFGLILLYTVTSLSKQLEIYETGIGVRNGKRFAFASWEALSHLEIREEGRNKIAGIVTHQPLDYLNEGNVIERWTDRNEDARFIELDIIKVARDQDHWAKPNPVTVEKLSQTEFGQVITNYMPHLFEGENQ